MALLTATELKASREAVKAGVSTVSDPEVETAITEAEAVVYRALGYKVEVPDGAFTFEGSGEAEVVLPQRARSITAVTDRSASLDASAWSLRGDGWLLKRVAGSWSSLGEIEVTGTWGFEAGHERRVIATKAVRLLAVYALQATKAGSGAAPIGAYLTGFSTESAQFTYFTPRGDRTGLRDVDDLLALIPHPFKGSSLFTVATARSIADLGPEAVWLGLEGLE